MYARQPIQRPAPPSHSITNSAPFVGVHPILRINLYYYFPINTSSPSRNFLSFFCCVEVYESSPHWVVASLRADHRPPEAEGELAGLDGSLSSFLPQSSPFLHEYASPRTCCPVTPYDVVNPYSKCASKKPSELSIVPATPQ